VLHKVREATSHLAGLNIAVMGCIVNGPGEMADADYGYVGKTAGTIALYRGKEEIKRVPEAEGVQELVALIKGDGKWVEPEVKEEAV
jgi:(E)-4-hydroxy-3-methylbut-2-enyl-diphosphate synthase